MENYREKNKNKKFEKNNFFFLTKIFKDRNNYFIFLRL
jgi:hypothetical protein